MVFHKTLKNTDKTHKQTEHNQHYRTLRFGFQRSFTLAFRRSDAKRTTVLSDLSDLSVLSVLSDLSDWPLPFGHPTRGCSAIEQLTEFVPIV
jgi:hypothetical protein